MHRKVEKKSTTKIVEDSTNRKFIVCSFCPGNGIFYTSAENHILTVHATDLKKQITKYRVGNNKQSVLNVEPHVTTNKEPSSSSSPGKPSISKFTLSKKEMKKKKQRQKREKLKRNDRMKAQKIIDAQNRKQYRNHLRMAKKEQRLAKQMENESFMDKIIKKVEDKEQLKRKAKVKKHTLNAIPGTVKFRTTLRQYLQEEERKIKSFIHCQ